MSSQMMDILKNIREMWPNFEVSEKDIKTTPPEFVQRFYLNIIYDFRVPMQNLNQMDSEICTRTTYPDTIEHLIPYMKLFVRMKKLLNEFKVCDFTLADVIDPRPKRTHKIMKVLINFWLYSNMRTPDIQDLIEEKEEKKKSVGALKDRRDELRKMLNNCRERQAVQEQEAEECRRDIKVLIEQVQSIDTEIKRTEANEQVARQSVAQLTEKMVDLEKQIVRKENSLKEIQKRLVTSPQRLMTRKMELKQEATQRKERLDHLKNTFANYKKLNEAFQQSIPLQKDLFDFFDEASEVQKVVKEGSAKLEANKSIVLQATQELNTQASYTENLRIQELQLQEALAGKDTAEQDRLKALDEEKDYLDKEMKKTMKACEERDLKFEEKAAILMKKISEKDEELNNLRKERETIMERAVIAFESTVDEAEKFFKMNLIELAKNSGD